MSAHELIHSSQTPEWYTPAPYIESARKVMGDIDLDPASCALANTVVDAKMFYGKDHRSLERDWLGRIWLNPPYGRVGPKFIDKLLTEHHAGRVSETIALVNGNCTDTRWFRPLWDYTLCFVHGRVKFWGQHGKKSPTHGSIFVYLGANSERFKTEFAQHGAVVRRYEGAA